MKLIETVNDFEWIALTRVDRIRTFWILSADSDRKGFIVEVERDFQDTKDGEDGGEYQIGWLSSGKEKIIFETEAEAIQQIRTICEDA